MSQQYLKVRDGDKQPVNIKTTVSGGYIMPHNIIEDIKGDNINAVINKLSDISSSLNNLNFSSNNSPLAPLTNKYPTDITKKKYTNYATPLVNIDWLNTSSGSFRIAEYDQDRKYITIYNDSDVDLYVSVANDDNSKIVVILDDLQEIKNLTMSYEVYQNSVSKELFKYTWNDITNIYTTFTQSHLNANDTGSYGYNINYLTIPSYSDNSGRFILYLTPDYDCENINKHNDQAAGNLYLTIGSNTTNIPINKEKNRYNVITQYSSSNGWDQNPSIEYYQGDGYTNGFIIDSLTEQPDGYSYILNSADSMTIYDTEAVLSYFGFCLSSSITPSIDVRITEAR
jgi:hypothetical protein